MSAAAKALGAQRAFDGTAYGQGMTKREYIAAAVMAQVAVSQENVHLQSLVEYSVKCADSLLEELERTK